MNKIIEQLNLDDDFLFAKVMSDKEICKKVLEKILNINIKDIEMPTEQKVIDVLLFLYVHLILLKEEGICIPLKIYVKKITL